MGVVAGIAAMAHQNHDHSKAAAKAKVTDQSKEALRSVNEEFNKTVKPIFEKSCFDCHSSNTKFPWYSELPVAKGLIASDINEAKTHLDMTEGFPFKGHGSPREDLEAILKSVQEGSMPPLRYRMMHWDRGLSAQERAAIKSWVENSLKILSP